MARYIDADRVLDFIKQYTPHFDGFTTMACVKTAIDKMPTADVEEVCRCKECGYSIQMDSLYCRYFNKNVDEDDFCSQWG